MKRLIFILFILGLASPSLALTVGGPDFTIPEESFYKREEAINQTLDRYSHYDLKLKSSLELELIGEKKLETSFETTDPKIEGQYYMLKVAKNFKDIIEPYIKIGTCNLKVKWQQNTESLTVEAEPGFVWAIGAKAKLWEFKDYGIKLTLDTQYRDADLSIKSASTSPFKNEQFTIREWQTTLLASKRYILPVGMRDYYIVPYTGLTFSFTDADVEFILNTTGQNFSLYDANEKNTIGLVFGCDVMPSLLSWYLLNFELRLINETAFTLGGTVKF